MTEELEKRLERQEDELARLREGVKDLVQWSLQAQGWMTRADNQLGDLSGVLADGTFKAQRFVLQDAEGNLRGIWGVNEKRAAMLTFFGADLGSPTLLELGVGPDGDQLLSMCDPKTGKPTLAMVSFSDGMSGLTLHDRNAKRGCARVEMFTRPDGPSGFNFYGSRGGLLKSLLAQTCADCGDEFNLDRSGVIRCPDCRVKRRKKVAG